MQQRLLTADIVYSGLGLPQRQAAIVVRDLGNKEQIIAIDDLAKIKASFPDLVPENLGFALSPPLANAYIDFDLSKLELELCLNQLKEQRLGAVGLRGIVKEHVPKLLSMNIQGVIYLEVSGEDPQKADLVFDKTVDALRAFRALEKPTGLKVGLLLSVNEVSLALLVKLARLVKHYHIPWQLDFSGLRSQSEALEDLYAAGVLAARPSLSHFQALKDHEALRVQKEGCVLIYSPSLGSSFAWDVYAKHNVSIGLATGEVTYSTEQLVQDIKTSYKVSPLALVWSAVKGGYRALGMQAPRIVRGDSIHKLYMWLAKD